MWRTLRQRWLARIIILLASASMAAAQSSLSLEDILAKNIEASGGKAKQAQLETCLGK